MKAPGSFKDPIGSVTIHGDHISRSCTSTVRPAIDAFLASTTYAELVKQCAILPARWDECAQEYVQPRLQHWTYPYEWSFSMLQAAALHTLQIQEKALQSGYTLKDASAYNITFLDLSPIHIDLFSFEKLQPEILWQGFEQFCREFLNPLLLESIFGLPFQGFYRASVNGISTEVLAKLCRFPLMFYPSVFKNITLKAWAERLSSRTSPTQLSSNDIPTQALVRLQLRNIKVLSARIRGLKSKVSSHWLQYAEQCNYTDPETEQKRHFIEVFLKGQEGKTLIDYGCNTGEYTRLALRWSKQVTACDSDPACIDNLYRNARALSTIAPLTLAVINIACPSPGIGWRMQERSPMCDRLLPTDAFLALALVHHLRVAENIPTQEFLTYLAANHTSGLLEYVSSTDPMMIRLLARRKNLDLTDYEEEAFRSCVERLFTVRSEQRISNTRTLLWVETI